jgi:hypothetical protein
LTSKLAEPLVDLKERLYNLDAAFYGLITRCQFYQHFLRQFFNENIRQIIICIYITYSKCIGKQKCANKNVAIECW